MRNSQGMETRGTMAGDGSDRAYHDRKSGPRHPTERSDGGDDTGAERWWRWVIFLYRREQARRNCASPYFNRVSSRAARRQGPHDTVFEHPISLCDLRV